MKKGRRLIALFMLAVFTLTAVLSGCADGKGTVTSDGTDDSSSGQANEITVGIAQDLDTSLDPHLVTAAGTREVLFNIFEGLVKPDSDGNITPAVAESYEFSPDGTVYTFHLRDGVRFHNGDEVTAEDVVYSIKRCAGMLDDGGDILVPAFSVITDVTAPDEKTVEVTLSEGNIELLAYFASTDAAIIPMDYADQAVAPVGTGPFQFVSRTPQESFVMERFDGYWGEKAYLDRVNYRIITDANTLVLSLKSGAIDVCAHLTVDQASDLGDAFTVYEGTMNLVQALYLNNAAAPFDNELVRQALCYAVNVEEINSFVCGGKGVAVGSSMYPAFGKYFMPELSDAYPYDPEKAKALLAQAGYPDGFTFTITVPSNYTQHVYAAQVVAQQLDMVGVKAELKQVEWGTWVSDTYQGRNFEATVVGVDSASMTARGMLERFASDSGDNFINYSNPDYDETLAMAMASTDEAEQTELYKRCLAILSETAANVYLEDLCDLVAVNPKLEGVKFYPIYVLDLSGVRYAE